MNTKRDPEAILAAWLDEGPMDMPDATRRSILTALPTTAQARLGRFAPRRRALTSNVPWFAGLALVSVIALGGFIYVTGARPAATPVPSPSPSAPPINSSTWATFSSARYGLSFKVPPTWVVTAAHRSGAGISSDQLGLPGGITGLMARSDPKPANKTDDEWWTDYFASLTPGGPCDDVPSNYGPAWVDGVTGFEFDGRGCGYDRAYVLKGGRVYQFTAITVGGPGVVDERFFTEWLKAVRLDPGSADDSVPTDPPS